MGVLRQSHSRSAFLTGRGVALGAIVGLHVLVGVGLLSVNLSQRLMVDTAEPVQVVLLQQQEVAPLPETPPKLVELPPAIPDLPQLDIPYNDQPAPTAITVSASVEQPAPQPQPSPQADVPVEVDQVEYLRQVRPRYPPQARRAGAQGTVFLRVVIDTEGRPREVRIHRSSGSEQLDAAAREAVTQFLFRPHRIGGVARSAQVIVPVEFTLHQRRVAQSN